MARKSKFLTFILSFVPGLGHVYLGMYTRGAIFFLAVVAVSFLMGFINDVMHIHFGNFLGMLIPVIWLASLVDSMVAADKINKYGTPYQFNEDGDSPQFYNKEVEDKQNRKVIAMVLSAIPGAGHMYLGLQRQGLQLMAAFFLCFFLTDWLKIGLFTIFVPLIWFYGFFDTMYKASLVEAPEDGDLSLFSWFKCRSWFFRDRSKLLGYGLIILGCYLLFERIVMPEIDKLIGQAIRNYLQTGIIAALFIAGGIKLLGGSKKSPFDERGDSDL